MHETEEIKEVRKLLMTGARMQMARDGVGNIRLRFRCGPFGLMTKRFKLRFEEAERLLRDYRVERE